jgi:hypothetical protein
MRIRLEYPEQELGIAQEFALAGVARVSLQHGTDHRSPPKQFPPLDQLCRAYINLPEPELSADDPDLSAVLTRLAHEQFPAQSPGLEHLGRLYAIAADHLPSVKNGPSLTEWDTVLGVSLVDYWRIGWILHAAFASNAGAIAWETLATDGVVELFKPLTWAQVRPVIDLHYKQTIQGAQQASREKAHSELTKWSYNPLEDHPILDTGTDLICPAPHWLFAQLTTTGLYYLGFKHFGDNFGQALGDAFESYAGAQLALLTYAEVHGEVTYDNGKKSCDYILVTQECIVLIECKSGRPNIDSRLGYGSAAMGKVKKAKMQLETTAALIQVRHSKFAHIPDDRPLLGLVLTLEPHYVIESWSEDLLSSTVLPIATADVLDFEVVIAALADRTDVGDRLRTRIWPRPPLVGPPKVRRAVDDLPQPLPRNPIVEGAWELLSDLPILAQLETEGSAGDDQTPTAKESVTGTRP